MRSSHNEHDEEAMLTIISAVRYAMDIAGVELTEEAQARGRRWRNFGQSLRILLGVFEWRYLLLPVALSLGNSTFEKAGYTIYVGHKQLYVFGVRIARWYVNHKIYRDNPTPPPPEPVQIRRVRRKRVFR